MSRGSGNVSPVFLANECIALAWSHSGLGEHIASFAGLLAKENQEQREKDASSRYWPAGSVGDDATQNENGYGYPCGGWHQNSDERGTEQQSDSRCQQQDAGKNPERSGNEGIGLAPQDA
jgi:hypothetical protein